MYDVIVTCLELVLIFEIICKLDRIHGIDVGLHVSLVIVVSILSEVLQYSIQSTFLTLVKQGSKFVSTERFPLASCC
jgi:hypothetical protein